MAQNRYWRPASAANLNYNNANNWSSTTPAITSPASPPTFLNGQTAIFDGVNVLGCNLNVATLGAGNVQIAAGYTGTITQTNTNLAFIVTGDITMAGGTITMRPDGLGNITAGGNYTQTGGTVNAVGGLQFDGNFTFDAPAVLNAGTSTVTFNGDNNGFPNRTININGGAAGTLTLYNVILDKANTGAQNLNIAGSDILTVQNDLILTNGSLGTGTGTVQVGRDLTIEPGFIGGLVDLVINGAGNSNVIVDAPFKIAGNGTFTVNKTNPASTVSFSTTLPSNDIILSTGALNGSYNITSGTVQFPDNDAATINYAALNISAGGTLSAPNNTLTIPGNIATTGTFTPNTGTVLLNGAAAQAISINGVLSAGTLNFYNLTLNNTSANGNIQLENLDIINVTNNFSVTDGRINVPGGGNTATLQVGGNLTTTTAAADATTTAVNLTFTGSNAQTVSLFAGTQSHFNGPVLFNKTGGDVTLASQFDLNQGGQTVTFTSGVVNTTATNVLSLGATTTVSGGNNSSYVNGFVRKTGNAAFTFPTGNAGFYAPIHMAGTTAFGGALPNNPTTGNAPTYQAQYIRSNPQVSFPNNAPQPTDGNIPATVLTLSQQEYYIFDFVSDIPGFPPTDYASANMPFLWMSYENLRSGGIAQPSSVAVIAWLTNRWENLSNGGLVNVGGIDYLRSNVRAFSAADNNPVYSFGTNNPLLNPLPVAWLDFTGRRSGSSVELAWKTASEKDNDKFTVERSADGKNFSALGTVAGNGSTDLTSQYTFSDKTPLSTIGVYRIKQTDLNGKFSYSKEIRVAGLDGSITGIRLYPNPAPTSATLYLENTTWRNQKVKVTIINALGAVVREEQISFSGDSRAKVNISGIQRGSYYMSTQVNGEKKVVPFIIQ